MICIPSRSKFLPFVRSSFVQRHYRYRCTRISSFLHWFWRIDQVHVLFFLQLESCPHPTSAVFQHGNNLVPRMMKSGHSFNLLPSQPNTPLIMLSNSSNIFCSEWPSLEPSEYQLLFLLRQPSYIWCETWPCVIWCVDFWPRVLTCQSRHPFTGCSAKYSFHIFIRVNYAIVGFTLEVQISDLFSLSYLLIGMSCAYTVVKIRCAVSLGSGIPDTLLNTMKQNATKITSCELRSRRTILL